MTWNNKLRSAAMQQQGRHGGRDLYARIASRNKRKQENISKSVLVDGESTEDRQDWSKALGAHSDKAKMTRTRTRRY